VTARARNGRPQPLYTRGLIDWDELVPLARVLGWSPSEFWRATWHDLTSHLWMHREMLKPRPKGNAVDIDDVDGVRNLFRGKG
jgi:hypothetical protein